MPTGYTSIIEEREVSFPEFLWRCARAFGAFVEMRDDGLDAPIPEAFKPSEYSARALAEAEIRREALRAMDDAQIEAAAAEANRSVSRAWRRDEKERTEKLARYDAMAEQVRAWKPPTPEHAGLREFMLDQIRISTEYMRKPRPAPGHLSPAEWMQLQVASAARDVEYYTTSLREERERIAGRNAWVADLRKSVPPPPASPAPVAAPPKGTPPGPEREGRS